VGTEGLVMEQFLLEDVELVAEGLRFPEGPVALLDGSVLVVEIERGTLSRVQPDGRVEVVAECGGGPNGAAIGPDGAVYVCNNGGGWPHFCLFSPAAGSSGWTSAPAMCRSSTTPLKAAC